MYELYDMGSGTYEIHSSFRHVSAQRGSFKSIMKHMMQHLDFDPGELDVAIQEMVRNNHDAAHFGINRGFIYSHNRIEKVTA